MPRFTFPATWGWSWFAGITTLNPRPQLNSADGTDFIAVPSGIRAA